MSQSSIAPHFFYEFELVHYLKRICLYTPSPSRCISQSMTSTDARLLDLRGMQGWGRLGAGVGRPI